MQKITDVLKNQRNNCIIFFGAGVSRAISGSDLSLWGGLLKNGIERCHIVFPAKVSAEAKRSYESLVDNGGLLGMLAVAQVIVKTVGGASSTIFKDWLATTVGTLPKKNPDLAELIAAFELPLVTTNYDTLAEQITGYEIYNWTEKQAAIEILNGVKKNAVLHLHGDWQRPESVIFDWKSYDDIVEDAFIQTLLSAISTLKTIIFIGFGAGMDDPNFSGFINWAKSHGVLNAQKKHYIVVDDAAFAKNNSTTILPGDITPISYGKDHAQLLPFLKRLFESLTPTPPPPPPPVNDFEKYILYLLPATDEEQIRKHFVGRESIMDDVLQSIAYKFEQPAQVVNPAITAKPRLFWISGFGGMGKSWLLIKIKIELAARLSNLKSGLIEWDNTELSEPYTRPASVEQMLEVIAQRAGQLYGKEAIREFICALAEVRKNHEDHNNLKTTFNKVVAYYEGKITNPGAFEGQKGDYIKPDIERELEEGVSILDSICNNRNLRSDSKMIAGFLKRLKTDYEFHDEIFAAWTLQKSANASQARISPDQYLTMSLKNSIVKAAMEHPLLIILDTCEVLSDKQDKYLRLLFKSLFAAKCPVTLLIGNRFIPDIFQKGRFSKHGWLVEIDRRLMKSIYIDQEPLSVENIMEMINNLERPYPDDEDLAIKLYHISKGIPFILKNIFELHETGNNILWELDLIYGDAVDVLSENEAIENILEATCNRILTHLETCSEDLEDIVLLAILPYADLELLRCYWNEFPRTRLEQLMRRHSFITNGSLHENARGSFRRNWRNKPIEMIETVIHRLTQILIDLRPVSVKEDVTVYFNWLVIWINVGSWTTTNVFPDLFKAYFLGSLHNANIKPIVELAIEIPGSSTGTLKAKEVFGKLGTTYSFFDTLDETILKYLEDLPFVKWDDHEKGCLFLFLGDNYYRKSRFSKSIYWFDQAFELFDNPFPQQNLMVKSYLESVYNFTIDGKNVKTHELYSKWSKKFDFASSHLNIEIGKVLHNTGGYQESNKLLRKALEEEPSNTEALVYLIHNMVTHLGEYQEALTLIEKKEATLKYDGRTYYHKGMAYEGLNDFYNAEQAYLSGYNTTFGYQALLAKNLINLYLDKQPDETKAVAFYEKLKPLYRIVKGDIAKYGVRLACWFEMSGNREKAAKYWSGFKKDIENGNLDALDYNGIAWSIYRSKSGKLDLAEELAQKGLNLDPANRHILQTTAAILIRQDKWAGSKKYLENWISQINGTEVEEGMHDFILMFQDIIRFGHQQEMVELLGVKRNDDAWGYIAWTLLKTIGRENEIQLLASHQKTAINFYARTVYAMGSLCWYDGSAQEAIRYYECYEKAVDTPSLEWYNAYGQVLLEVKRYQEAEPFLTHVIEQKSGKEIKAYSLNGRGLSRGKQQRFDEAFEDFKQSLILCPNNAWTYLNRAQVYEALNETRKAVEDYQTSLIKRDQVLPLFKRQYAEAQIERLSNK